MTGDYDGLRSHRTSLYSWDTNVPKSVEHSAQNKSSQSPNHNKPQFPNDLVGIYDDCLSKDRHLNETFPPKTNKLFCHTSPHLASSNSAFTFTPLPTSSSPYHDHQETDSKNVYDSQRKTVQDAVDMYIKFIPRLNHITSNKFGELLVEILNQTENEVSLDDFFRLFYTIQPQTSLFSALKDLPYQTSSLETKSKGLALCRLIHDTFMNPLPAAIRFGVNSQQISDSNINNHEFHRVFLAIKIFLHSLEEVDEPSQKKSSLTKASVYNMYQIYCFRLFNQHSANVDESSFPESLILGQANTGKLIRIIFTNVGSKRLGKRGCSKYHFTGITWRQGALDDEIRQLIHLEPSEVRSRFAHTFIGRSNHAQAFVISSSLSTPKVDLMTGRGDSSHPRFASAPLLSYVKLSSRFPAVHFSPRMKEITPRRVPQQSDWLRGIMYRSVNALKSYNVEFEQLISDFQAGDFSVGSQRSLSQAMSRAEEKLDRNCSSEDAYLHLHLTVLTLVLPAVLASDEEIQPASKILLRASLRQCVKEVEARGSEPSRFKKNHRRIFMSNMQKLISISETISVSLPKELAIHILHGIIENIRGFKKERDFPSDETALVSVCSKAVITMLNAHSQLFPISEQEKIALTNQIIQFFLGMGARSNAEFRRMLGDIESDDSRFKVEGLRFAMFKSFADTFHDRIGHMPFILQIPIHVLRFYFGQIDMEIQSMNLRAFGKHHPQVATETFKTWWLITTAFHEYLKILSEIVALSQSLSGE